MISTGYLVALSQDLQVPKDRVEQIVKSLTILMSSQKILGRDGYMLSLANLMAEYSNKECAVLGCIIATSTLDEQFILASIARDLPMPVTSIESLLVERSKLIHSLAVDDDYTSFIQRMNNLIGSLPKPVALMFGAMLCTGAGEIDHEVGNTLANPIDVVNRIVSVLGIPPEVLESTNSAVFKFYSKILSQEGGPKKDDLKEFLRESGLADNDIDYAKMVSAISVGFAILLNSSALNSIFVTVSKDKGAQS